MQETAQTVREKILCDVFVLKDSRKLISKYSSGQLCNIQFYHSQGVTVWLIIRFGIFMIVQLLFLPALRVLMGPMRIS